MRIYIICGVGIVALGLGLSLFRTKTQNDIVEKLPSSKSRTGGNRSELLGEDDVVHNKTLSKIDLSVMPPFDKKKLEELLGNGEALSVDVKELIAGQFFHWATEDPQSALAFIDETEALSKLDSLRMYIPAVLAAWADESPFDVVEFLLANPYEFPVNPQMARDSISKAIAMDSDLFLQRVESIPGDWFYLSSRSLVSGYIESDRYDYLKNHVSFLPAESEQKKFLLAGMADSLAIRDWQRRPEDLADIIALADTKEAKRDLTLNFLMTAAYGAPDDVMKWVADNVKIEEENMYFKNALMSDWASRDVTSFATWVSSLPSQERSDNMLAKIVEPIATEDPISALLWIDQIEDQAMKKGLSKSVLMRIDSSSEILDEVESLRRQGELGSELFEN